MAVSPSWRAVMSAVSTIPMRVEPEAMAHIAKLGMAREFEKMLDHIRQVVPDLCRIEVTLYEEPDFDDDPRVTIDAIRNGSDDVWSAVFAEWCSWTFANVSPDVI